MLLFFTVSSDFWNNFYFGSDSWLKILSSFKFRVALAPQHWLSCIPIAQKKNSPQQISFHSSVSASFAFLSWEMSSPSRNLISTCNPVTRRFPVCLNAAFVILPDFLMSSFHSFSFPPKYKIKSQFRLGNTVYNLCCIPGRRTHIASDRCRSEHLQPGLVPRLCCPTSVGLGPLPARTQRTQVWRILLQF